MSEPASIWRSRSAWEGHAQIGRSGRSEGAAGVTLTPRSEVGLATVIPCGDGTESLNRVLSERFGLQLPEAGRTHFVGEHGLIWSGPNQWLSVSPTRASARQLASLLYPIAAVTDQSDARGIVRIAGPRAREMLAKGIAVDLHPRNFDAGSACQTAIAHIGIQLWQLSNDPVYELAVPRSFAGSVWSWLLTASAEFGAETYEAMA